MYFWDSINNAQYWYNEKNRKDPTKKYIRVSANIFIDEDKLLELSDPVIEDRLEVLWKMYCEKMKEHESQPLGIKINKLIDFYDMLEDVKVVRGIGVYSESKKEEKRFLDNNKKNRPHITGNLKTIYCVRDCEFAVNRSM